MVSANKYTNHLINQSSPYLLMHAHNPVDWFPWGTDALEKAKKENKLLIISIGYAACHWCHVMEEESFSDPQVAETMNRHYVCIKVDREERPDIDQIYMEAAQLITGSGGWPLNAIALPDGRPILAMTYLPKERWVATLTQVHDIYRQDPQKIIHQAQSITDGIRESGLVSINTSDSQPDPHLPDQMVKSWLHHIDWMWGGENRAPKFPLPISYRYLLAYFHLTRHSPHMDRIQGDKALLAVTKTLDHMAMGGIYDQVGGGFARYSTDSQWKVPHFEKMLYDNAQLVSLYSYAFQLTQNPHYRSVVLETLRFVDRELTSPPVTKGGKGFYSSLDADSDGEEGKFYVWSKEEVQKALGEDAPVIIDYFNITEQGNWENGHNILLRNRSDEEFASEKNIELGHLHDTVARAKKILLETRSQRVPPPLDDKILTAWNSLMLTGYVDAYRVFGHREFLDTALENAAFILNNMMSETGQLERNFKNDKSSINAFLDDYAFTIQAFVSLYQATFDEQWLIKALNLLDYTLKHFFDEKSGMFFYTSDQDPQLVARKMENTDNVIPGSNSQMAMNLFLLGTYFEKEEYIRKSRQMLINVQENMSQHGPYFSNWGLLMNHFIHPPAEIAIVGPKWEEFRQQLDAHYLPSALFLGGSTEGRLPLLQHKLVPGKTTIYVCRNKTCNVPVETVEEALKQVENT